MFDWIPEMAVAVDEVLEHHPVSLELRQRHRDADAARSGDRKSPRLRPRAHLRRRKHLLRRKNRSVSVSLFKGINFRLIPPKEIFLNDTVMHQKSLL